MLLLNWIDWNYLGSLFTQWADWIEYNIKFQTFAQLSTNLRFEQSLYVTPSLKYLFDQFLFASWYVPKWQLAKKFTKHMLLVLKRMPSLKDNRFPSAQYSATNPPPRFSQCVHWKFWRDCTDRGYTNEPWQKATVKESPVALSLSHSHIETKKVSERSPKR